MLRKSFILYVLVSLVMVFGCKISGKIEKDGVGLSGVAVKLSGAASKTTTTDGAGNYSFDAGIGNFTVTPVFDCGQSDPASREIVGKTLFNNIENVDFSNVEKVYEGDYAIDDLDDINGLMGYTSVSGNLEVYYTALENLDGLECLEQIDGNLLINLNTSLTSLEGLMNVTSVGEGLEIRGNYILPDLEGLNNIETVGGYLYIELNSVLTDISGLSSLTSVGTDFTIQYNPVLCDSLAEELRDQVTIGGTVTIASNLSCRTTYYEDADSDGYGNPDVSQSATSQPEEYVIDNTDCDDTDASIHPGAVDTPDDEIDQDCNGVDGNPNLEMLLAYLADDDALLLEFLDMVPSPGLGTDETIYGALDGSCRWTITMEGIGGRFTYNYQGYNETGLIMTGVKTGRLSLNGSGTVAGTLTFTGTYTGTIEDTMVLVKEDVTDRYFYVTNNDGGIPGEYFNEAELLP